jgi:hypothetical protein
LLEDDVTAARAANICADRADTHEPPVLVLSRRRASSGSFCTGDGFDRPSRPSRKPPEIFLKAPENRLKSVGVVSNSARNDNTSRGDTFLPARQSLGS